MLRVSFRHWNANEAGPYVTFRVEEVGQARSLLELECDNGRLRGDKSDYQLMWIEGDRETY